MTTPTVTGERTFATVMESLRTALPGWEPRTQQVDLATGIEEWIANQESNPETTSMFAQAPTGTGKSLAYLIPAILSGKRVVISVTTKALQDQLSGSDLPFLDEHVGGFTWAVLKGRGNYLCTQRLEKSDGYEVPVRERLLAWLKTPEAQTFSGMREDLPLAVEDSVWREIAAETDECRALGCDGSNCYAEMARATARNARIVVVNHALFFTDLYLRAMIGWDDFPGMIGTYDMVVMDEAHEVREVATNTLAADMTAGTFRHLAGLVRTWVSRYASESSSEGLLNQATAMVSSVERMFTVLPGEAGETRRLYAADLEEHADVLVDVAHNVQRMAALIASAGLEPGSDVDMGTAKRKSLETRVNNANARMVALLTDAFEDTVRWVEINTNWKGEKIKALKVSPVDVSGYLRGNLYSRTPVLMVSATLAVGGKFDYVSRQLGVDNWVGQMVDSPFDFQTQARLYIADSLPAPTGRSQTEWENGVKFEITELVRAAQGRTLILFTSIKHMRSIRNYLEQALDYPVKMQGDPGESIDSLKRWFLENTDSVLLGTKSLFTGFDPRGESCSQVIITKFPFPVPTDPMVQARGEAVEARGGRSFFDLMVPETSLVVQQMAGRAIRHTTDRAVIAILDPRAVSKGYGAGLVRDLGDIPRAKDRNEVRAFHKSIREHFATLGSAS